MKKLLTITIASAVSYLLFGCASVVTGVNEGHPNRKTVIGVPKNITVIQTAEPRLISSDKPSYELWQDFVINRGNGPFKANSVELWREGKLVGIIKPRVNPWIFGNLIYGGIPGLLVDGFSGAMWEHDLIIWGN
jgi:hypothetical protein